LQEGTSEEEFIENTEAIFDDIHGAVTTLSGENLDRLKQLLPMETDTGNTDVEISGRTVDDTTGDSEGTAPDDDAV